MMFWVVAENRSHRRKAFDCLQGSRRLASTRRARPVDPIQYNFNNFSIIHNKFVLGTSILYIPLKDGLVLLPPISPSIPIPNSRDGSFNGLRRSHPELSRITGERGDQGLKSHSRIWYF